MPRYFAITSTTTTISLSPEGKGEFAFTISNEMKAPVRAKATVLPAEGAKQEWLRVVGDPERDFVEDQTHLFTVQILVPKDVPKGSYKFRLLVASIGKPDEEYTEGPLVAFEVPEPGAPAPEKKKFPWWIVAVVAGVLLIGGGAVALVMALRPDCARSDDCKEAAQECQKGKCVARESFACAQDTDCRTGEACEPKASRCVVLGAACTIENAAEHCGNGTWQKVEGQPVRCVSPNVGSSETCNNVDDNCNGEVDEGIVVGPCEAQALGECRQGTRRCEGGALSCFPAAPGAETCDAKDNDCDGQIDEGIAASPCVAAQAKGECRNGTRQCLGGALSCTPAASIAETCDGKDNDCDGQVDDGIATSPCVATQAKGECRNGTRQCHAGTLSCFPANARAETCDGKDNDCDGLIFETGTCPTISFRKEIVSGAFPIIKTIGGTCSSGFRKMQCKVNRTDDAKCTTAFKSATPTDCACTVTFAPPFPGKRGSCEVEITQMRLQAAAP